VSAQATCPIWVLDDPRTGTAAQALGIAERLGMPFARLPLSWNWKAHLAALVPHGSLAGLGGPLRVEAENDSPALVISAGSRSAPVALWVKHHLGGRLVHCMRPGLAGWMRREQFDLLVIPRHDSPPEAPNILPVLAAPHRVSPLKLRQAGEAWAERLAHLPHPRVVLLVGGPVRATGLAPALAHRLGRQVAAMALERGGAVLATTSRRTGEEATDALAAGLARSLNVLYRWGEPGDNPYLGFLASADAIVVTADSVSMVSEACATGAPVFVALPELAGPRHRKMLETLLQAGQIRPLEDDLSPWPRERLDEAEHIAAEIRRRFGLG
jgi:hypothetical protein